jgi:hypothetical protein
MNRAQRVETHQVIADEIDGDGISAQNDLRRITRRAMQGAPLPPHTDEVPTFVLPPTFRMPNRFDPGFWRVARPALILPSEGGGFPLEVNVYEFGNHAPNS